MRSHRHRNPSGRPYTAEELAIIYQSAPEDLKPYLLDLNFPNNLEWDVVEQPRLSPEELRAISDPAKRRKARARIVAAETKHNQAQDTLLWEIEEFRKSDEFLKGFVLYRGTEAVYGPPKLVYDSRFDKDHWGELWSEGPEVFRIGFYDREFARVLKHDYMRRTPLQSYAYIDEHDRTLDRWYAEQDAARDAARAKIDQDATAMARRYYREHDAFHREVIDGLMSGKVDPTTVWIMASRYPDVTDVREKNLATWSVDLLRSREFSAMFPKIPDVPLRKSGKDEDIRKASRPNAFLIATKKLHNEQLVWYALDYLLGRYDPKNSYTKAQALEDVSQLLAYERSDGAGDMTLVSPSMNSDIAIFGKAVVDGYREAGRFEDFASFNTAMEYAAQTIVPPYMSRVFTTEIIASLTKLPSFVFKHLVRTVTDPLNQVKIPESVNRRADEILADQGLI